MRTASTQTSPRAALAAILAVLVSLLAVSLLAVSLPAVAQPAAASASTPAASPAGAEAIVAVAPATAAQVAAWRSQIRRTLYIPDPLPPLQPRSYGSFTPMPGVVMERVSYGTGYGLRVPADIFRPAAPPKGKLPAIVVVNGHGADKSSWYAWYTGMLYAKAGAVVLTYDPIGEGERNDDHKDATGEHDRLITSPPSMPPRLGGLMVLDVMQAVGYLSQRADVDPHRIAVLGFSMGSFISSLAGAADPRIHALLLDGGGDLDGPGGYWDSGHAVMCQALPYKALLPLGDRPAVLFTLSARRGSTFIINGTGDTVVDIPHHGPDFFAALRQRVVALNGGDRGVFTTYFDPGASHRPSWMTRTAAEWLGSQLHFPAWPAAAIPDLPTISIRDWAARVGFPLVNSYARQDRDAGIQAIDEDIPMLTAAETDVMTREQWNANHENFVYATWVARASAAGEAEERSSATP